MSKLLVTGGAGFIGANFVHYWMREYPKDIVFVLDALTYAGNVVSLDGLSQNPLFQFVEGNILDQPLIENCLLYTSPSPRDRQKSRMPSSA